ncbi:MAG TPA: phosphatidate cytidylyltransferase [Pirellulaceae bacterium]|jgi:phosphatidate cytidylyltransferase
MNEHVRERLFDWRQSLAEPFTVYVSVALLAIAVSSPLVIVILSKTGRLSEKAYRELLARCTTWAVLVPVLLAPILAGAAWTILAVGLLSWLCYWEFAANTPLKNEWSIHVAVTLGIAAVTFGALDHWWEFFSGAFPLTLVVIVAISIFRDSPNGYLQRVALGTLGFGLFGMGLGHLGYIANDDDYRPILILIFVAVEANDIFAYLSGKTFGHRKLAPHTSPNKTIGGSVGAVVLTSVLVIVLGHWAFAGTAVDKPIHLATIGVMISVLGQLGDLVLSSVKRDLGIKDMGTILPGHGGLLDRFDSLLLVAPAIHYYLGYFHGLGTDQPVRIFSGS